MSALSQDSTKVLTEKLTLAREIAILKPEIESLRAQVETNKSILSEKLSLQRQLTTVQVELENAQRTAQRAIAKAGNNHDQSEFDLQIDDLQQKLREAKLARREAEAETEQLKHDLEADKRTANKSKSKKAKQDGNLAEMDDEIQSLKKELVKAKDDASRWEKEASSVNPQKDDKLSQLRDQIKELQKELLNERKDKQKLEKTLQKEHASWEAQKSILDDKLEQFRIKLRSTKDRLKETEAELEARNEGQPKPITKSTKTKTSKKRNATELEAPLGTPGDDPAPKRGKRVQKTTSQPSMPGAKSDFSITPFRNRTSLSLAAPDPDTPVEESTDVGATADAPPTITVEDIDSPAAKAASKKATKPKVKPLSSAQSSKHNSKANKLGLGRMSSLPSLAEVAEESSELSKPPPTLSEPIEAAPPSEAAATEATKNSIITNAPKLKPRKSLMTFSSYLSEPPAEKKKKRKLGGTGSSGIGKTLFDEEDEADAGISSKPIPGRGLFAARVLAKSKSALGGKGANAKGQVGKLVTAEGGFQFSPLKRDRRAVGASILE
jgi:myosin heavy subunit